MGIPFEAILAFSLTSLLIELTPGPNMTYLALVSIRSGRAAGFATVAGIAAGLLAIGMAAAFGLAEVITASPVLFATLRWGGVAYLCSLAWEAWHDSGAPEPRDDPVTRRFLWRGFVTNLLNPKAAIVFIAVLPPFIDPAAAPLPQSVLLSAVYVAVATAIHLVIVMLASTLRPLLENRRAMAASGKVFAVALAGVAAWVAWSTR